MRPVDKGTARRSYTRYQQALDDLEAQLGLYCSYCERRIPVGLEVEHMSPKSRGGALTDWANLLLGCKTCNTIKNARNASSQTSLWPDTDNTFRAFAYRVGGFVALAANLTPPVDALAAELLDLVKLCRHGAIPGDPPTRRDKRWSQREEVWRAATIAKGIYQRTVVAHPQDALDALVSVALGQGFFSVWMTVFFDTPAVCHAFVISFPGTDPACFQNGVAVQRAQREDLTPRPKSCLHFH